VITRLVIASFLLSANFSSLGLKPADARTVSVQIPQDQLDTRLAVPVNIQLPSDGSISALEIFGNSGRYIKISLPLGLKISQVMTRFMAVDSEIGVTSFSPNGDKTTQIFKLKFSSPSTIPKESIPIQRQIGSSMMRFEPKFSGYEIRRNPGEVFLVVRNASSISSFVEKVSLSFAESGNSYQVSIEGSPFWFEPFIAFRGIFSDVSVNSIFTN
jgi:hypothetical protein